LCFLGHPFASRRPSDLAPPEQAGAPAGIPETSSEFGRARAIAILGAIGTAVYRDELEEALPAGVPVEAAEGARDTLGAAVSAGDRVPGLVESARDAFTEALQLAATVSAAAVIAAAVLMLWLTDRGQARRVLPEAG
jgi:DHA2 family multidrug resistance protein-like MFS transporter